MVSENASRFFVHILVLHVRSCEKRECFEIYSCQAKFPFLISVGMMLNTN